MVPEKIWNEVVDDLWTKRLTLAVGDGSFGGFKSSGVNYGFSAATPQVENSLVDDLASATTESTSENVAVTDVEGNPKPLILYGRYNIMFPTLCVKKIVHTSKKKNNTKSFAFTNDKQEHNI